jgi:hypothetical protein
MFGERGCYDDIGALETIAIRLHISPAPTDVPVPPFPWARVLAVAGVLAALAGASVLALAGQKDDTVRRERAATATERRAIEARVKAEQAPQRARLAPSLAGVSEPAERVARRERLVAALEEAITADAQERRRSGALPADVSRTVCAPFVRPKRANPPQPPPAARSGRYECFAVSSELPATERTEAVVGGFPFWARVDFERGSAVWCKVRPRPAEGGVTGSIDVPLPRACELRRG